MNKRKLNHYKELLMNEKKEVEDTLRRMDEFEPNASLREYFDELSAYDNHPADIGTETYEMEMNFNLKNNEALRLKEIDQALDKIADGSYGNCITCGKEIPEDRLEILPTAIQCMDCDNKGLSIHKEVDTRPVEEEVLYPPFGRSYKDNDENYNGFDGEDSWQAVVRFNDVPNDPSDSTGDYFGDFDEGESGIVQEVEQISEEYYRGQIPGLERDDIPDHQKKRK
ncbi:TraR/DksA C4-type zinc finger protein [Geosporobacter ferrireducens]|uniref:Molecular chaperone DnaK n=1 Tax=Geosporobacter ferrireducens TaxID=1424294 RepID=A0A1D8GC39_9FIRM|nr:TraR/DksA C4-type zinc finger protein [Geosporobacter ferrireducens]AOT68430.1 molecular chaperone DnaK [Geosporobacter ferrireducens]MTI53886.1 molecular chaperone DnaK [Geosporobacter ferrireducens]